MEHHECERGRCSCAQPTRDIKDTYEPTAGTLTRAQYLEAARNKATPHSPIAEAAAERIDATMAEPIIDAYQPTADVCSGSPHGFHSILPNGYCEHCGRAFPLVKGGQGRSGRAVEESVVTFGYFVMGVIVGGTIVLSVRAILWAAGWLS